MRTSRVVALAALTIQTSVVTAIRVATGSPCSAKCGNVLDQTSSDNIVCDEGAYSSGDGMVFKNCVTCEARSTYVTEGTNGKESDLQWMICEFLAPFSYGEEKW